jgi:hypothetical protein
MKGPFVPQIDWFASCDTTQLPRFCAWQEGMQGAECLDAFQQDWSHEPGYMFPPFSLLPKVLKKIRDERARMVLIHPEWPGALWGPTLNSEYKTKKSVFGIHPSLNFLTREK